MAVEQASTPGGSANALYDWWLGALPKALGAGQSSATADGAEAWPFPADRMADALGLAKGMLDGLYGGYLRALAAGQPGDPAGALEGFVQRHLADIAAKFTGLAGQGPAALGKNGDSASLAAIGEALKPLMQNVERTYGGVADAFGLAPVRELQRASKDMALAAVAHRQAQAEYLDIVAGALGKGAESLMQALAEMSGRGESVDSLLALIRLWARTTDAAVHEAMQSQRALQACAGLIRAASRSRQQQRRVVGIVSEGLGVPTRAEMDEAYRQIQALKRELRGLRKGSAAPSSATPGARKPAGTRRSRKEAHTA